MAMLVKEKTFLDYLLRTTITPTHLTSTGSAVSPDTDALNCRDKLCPEIMAWLLSVIRKGDWECKAHEHDNSAFQHDRGGGRECDADGCVLLHPEEETRWIVLRDKKSEWAEAMTLDEAISFQGEDSSEMKALTEDTPDCTYADVWRASIAALAFGPAQDDRNCCRCAKTSACTRGTDHGASN
jgi:hypothetical protein